MKLAQLLWATNLLLVPLFGDTLSLDVGAKSGKAEYDVWSGDLRSTLIFPYRLQSTTFTYTHKVDAKLSLGIFVQLPLHKDVAKGEDFDWKASDPTVYSSSLNHLESYKNSGIFAYYRLNPRWRIEASVAKKYYAFRWDDTHQINYITGATPSPSGGSLAFTSDITVWELSPAYSAPLGSFVVEVVPQIGLYEIETKDTHLLRHFYTTQSLEAFGYGVQTKVVYPLSHTSHLQLHFHTKRIAQTQTPMHYYTDTGIHMHSYDSNYKQTEHGGGIAYEWSF